MVVVGLAPVWARYGALAPGHGHGGSAAEVPAFLARADAYTAEHALDDGAVEAVPGDEPIPVVVRQFGFQPRELRLRTGERYVIELMSIDVIHGFSLYAGDGSVNAQLVPGEPVRIEVVPTRPGRYLVLCNEYCGVGHHVMSGVFVVEGDAIDPAAIEEPGHDEDAGHEGGDGGHEAPADDHGAAGETPAQEQEEHGGDDH
jgi:cytochrome c oxidase subunit 2